LSYTRVRLRALASLGLSMILFGALVPATSASGIDVPGQAVGQVAPAAASPIVAPAIPAAASLDLVAAGGPTAPTTRAALARRLGEDIDELNDGPAAAPASGPAVASPSRAATVAAASRVIALAESHIGARYQHGATGPRAFDCSGLVYRVFEDAGLGRMIGGLRSASALYAHFRALHMTSTANPQPGDLVIFGGGSHVGIYIGAGRVVHAMVSGVAITRIGAVYPRFTAFVHLGLTKIRLAATRARRAVRRPAIKVIERVRTTVALSLRGAASTASRRLAILPTGARLSVIRIARDRHHVRWFEVVAPGGRTGWIAARYAR
jgi:cell wall-associated NlpC family hydrolase